MKLPTSWGEVYLSQYIKISEISSVDMDEIDKQVKILSLLSGEDEETVLSLPLPKIKQCNSAISFIYSVPKTKGIKKVIKVGGKRFLINHNLSEITGGEYIDLSTYTKDATTVTPNLHYILSIFFHPINIFGMVKKESYIKNANGKLCQKLERRNKTAQLLKDNLTMDEVFSLSAFFLKSWERLTETTQDYLEKQALKIANKAGITALQTIGGGI